jgi:hypothetical protein
VGVSEYSGFDQPDQLPREAPTRYEYQPGDESGVSEVHPFGAEAQRFGDFPYRIEDDPDFAGMNFSSPASDTHGAAETASDTPVDPADSPDVTGVPLSDDRPRAASATTNERQPDPRYDLRGPWALPAEHYGFSDWWEGRSQELRSRPFPGEVDPTEREKEYIDDANDAIAQMGDDMGIGEEMRRRLQPLAEHHLLPDRDAYIQGLRERYGETGVARYGGMSARGHANPRDGIVWSRDPSPKFNRDGLFHEKMHGVSGQILEPNLPYSPGYGPDGRALPYTHGDPKLLHNGYTDLRDPRNQNQGPHGFTEFVTDMAADRALQMTDYQPLTPNYRPFDILSAGVIEQTALRQGMDPNEIDNGLVKGMWVPTARDMLGAVREALGADAYQQFVNLSGHMYGHQAAQYAYDWGLPNDVMSRLDAYDKGRPVNYFPWHG